MEITKQVIKLATSLGAPAFSGAIPLLAAKGMINMSTVSMLAMPLIVGPGAILTAVLLEGTAKERALSALAATLLAGILIVITAVLGPKMLGVMNIEVLKIIGGIAVVSIALMIMGIKIPEITPVIIMLIGAIASFIWR